MFKFSSKREKRLWLYTIIVLVAIYATIGLAQSAALAISGTNIDVALFLFGAFLVLLVVITQGLKVRPSGLEISIAIGILAAYIMIFIRMLLPGERSHIYEYGIVGIFIFEALLERKKNGKKVYYPALIAIALTTLIGAIDECIQLFVPSRVFDPTDMIFNFIASVMSISSSISLTWARKKIGRTSPQDKS